MTKDTHNTQLTLGNSDVAPRAFSSDSRFDIQDVRSQAPDSLAVTSNSQLRIPHPSSQQVQFLLRVAPGALESERVYEVPACVTLAQAILESATSAGWGSSSLFRIANNPFGIKFSHRAIEPSHDQQVLGSTGLPIPDPYGAFDAQTWEIENGQKKVMVAQFQRFPNLTEAFKAHAQLLCSPHYQAAFAVRHDWKQFAERLGPKTSPLDSEHCGYSTNPSYSAELIKLVVLYRLNDPRAVEWLATGQDPGHGASTGRIVESSDQRVIENPAGRRMNP